MFAFLLSSRVPSLASRTGRSTFVPPAGTAWRARKNWRGAKAPELGLDMGGCSLHPAIFKIKNSYLIQYFNRRNKPSQ